jgi:hypothetical protein
MVYVRGEPFSCTWVAAPDDVTTYSMLNRCGTMNSPALRKEYP